MKDIFESPSFVTDASRDRAFEKYENEQWNNILSGMNRETRLNDEQVSKLESHVPSLRSFLDSMVDGLTAAANDETKDVTDSACTRRIKKINYGVVPALVTFSDCGRCEGCRK